VPPLVLGTLLLCFLILLSATLGRRLLVWLRVKPESTAEHGLFAIGMGLGSLQFVTFTLFAAGLGQPPVFVGVIGCLFLLLSPDIARTLLAGWRWLRQPRKVLWWEWPIVAVFVLLLAATYLRALCPITDDDGLSYHLAAPVRFLQQGGFVQIPTLTYTNWPLGVESLFGLLLAFHPAAPVGIVQFSFAVLTLVAVYLYAQQLGGRVAAAASAVLLLLYAVFWEEAHQAHVDLGMAAFAVLGVLALARSEAAPTGNWRRLSAVFAGLAATTKLSGIWVVVSLAFLTLLLERRRRAIEHTSEEVRPPWRPALGYALTAFCIVMPWFIRTWLVTGNPFYPMFYGLFGGREWTAEGWPRIQRYFLLMNTLPGLPPTPTNLLLARTALVTVTLSILLLVLWRTRRSPLLLPMGFAACFVMLVCLGSGYNLRFLLAAYPCVMLCLAVAATKQRPRLAPLFAVLAVLLGWHVAVKSSDHSLSIAVQVATGGMTREAYLRARLPDFRVVEFANRQLPPTARILVATWEESTAYYRPLALRPNYWLQDSVHYDSDERLVEDLRRLSVTHIVFRSMYDEWCLKSAVCSGRLRTEERAISALAKESGTKLYEADGTHLYAVNLDKRTAGTLLRRPEP
jgi:hypothetical protein